MGCGESSALRTPLYKLQKELIPLCSTKVMDEQVNENQGREAIITLSDQSVSDREEEKDDPVIQLKKKDITPV